MGVHFFFEAIAVTLFEPMFEPFKFISSDVVDKRLVSRLFGFIESLLFRFFSFRFNDWLLLLLLLLLRNSLENWEDVDVGIECFLWRADEADLSFVSVGVVVVVDVIELLLLLDDCSGEPSTLERNFLRSEINWAAKIKDRYLLVAEMVWILLLSLDLDFFASFGWWKNFRYVNIKVNDNELISY